MTATFTLSVGMPFSDPPMPFVNTAVVDGHLFAAAAVLAVAVALVHELVQPKPAVHEYSCMGIV